MSWFDTSFTFAKTALNQAQKSLDKVLDIKENEVQPEIDDSSSIPRPSATLAKSTPPTPQTAPAAHETIQSQLSSPLPQSKQSQDSELKSQQKYDSFTSKSTSSLTSGVNSSTWGGAGDFWSSPLSTPSPAKSGTTKKQRRQPSSRSADSIATKSAESGITPLRKQTSKSDESAASKNTPQPLQDTPQSSQSSRSTNLSSSTPDGKGVLYDVRSRLEGPAMTSTPVAEDSGGNKHRQRDKTSSGEQAQEPQLPLSPLSSVSPTNDKGNSLLPDPGQPTGELTTSQVEATDGSTEHVVGTNKDTGTLCGGDDKDVGVLSVCVNADVDDAKDSKQEQEVINTGGEASSMGVASSGGAASVVGVVSSGGVVVQDTQPEEQRKENAPAALEVSPTAEEPLAGSPPATVEVPSTVSEQLESISLKLDTTPPSEETPTNAAKPQEEEEVVMGEANGSLQIVSPLSTGMGNSEDGAGGALLGEEQQGGTSGNSPSVATGQEQEEVQRLKKELAHAQHMLNIREQKMVLMSQQIVEQMEANQTLQSELEVLKGEAQSDVQEMREEFTKRIGMSEKKLQSLAKERDSLKKQLAAFQNEQTQHKRSESEELSKILNEKDEKIAQLLEEGEKLSKQELQSNGIIKKLRLKERQNDQLLAAQRQQVEDLEGKVKNLKDQIKKKEENEKKYQESLAQLNTIAEQQAKELASLKTEKDGLLERVRSLQTNLDSSYKELSNLQKANAVNQSTAQEAVASAEKTKQAEVKIVLEQQKVASQKEKESLIIQIEELRMSVSRAEQQLAWKEDHMNQEIANVQTRLQEAEDRNQELTSTISQATKPLLRQIENLRSAHSAQSSNWEKIETGLNQRLVEAQTQLNVALEKERSTMEKHMTLKSRVGALEAQLSSVKQEKSQLLATVELERAKLETLEESQHRESSKLEALRASYQQSSEGLRKEKEMLERQLEYERVRLEAESRKACLESQEKERLRSQLANSLSSLNRSMSRQSSSGSQGEVPERGSQNYSRTESGSGEIFVLGGHTRGGSALALEQLHASLKQKDGELANVQNLFSSLERSRAAMADDLAKLSAQNEVLNQQAEKIPSLLKELEEVRKKHEAMLQMYGEKAEEAEELKLDIQDLKSMYRQQIDELVSRRRH